MNGRTILSSLRQMCRDIDAGRPLRRINLGRAVAPVIIGFSLVAGGCPDEPEPNNEATLYGADLSPPTAEVCTDGIDNDGDGRMGCDDDECASQGACVPSPLHGAPPPGSGTTQ